MQKRRYFFGAVGSKVHFFSLIKRKSPPTKVHSGSLIFSGASLLCKSDRCRDPAPRRSSPLHRRGSVCPPRGAASGFGYYIIFFSFARGFSKKPENSTNLSYSGAKASYSRTDRRTLSRIMRGLCPGHIRELPKGPLKIFKYSGIGSTALQGARVCRSRFSPLPPRKCLREALPRCTSRR